MYSLSHRDFAQIHHRGHWVTQRRDSAVRARSLDPLVKAQVFGMTPRLNLRRMS